MTPVVRPATAADALAILEVRKVSWRATYGDLLPDHVWDEMDPLAAARRWAPLLADGRRHGLVAEVDETVRAYALYGRCRDKDLPDAGEVMAIYAHPDHWSTGLGRALLPAAVAALDRRPVVLWVLESNARARRFYERAGFRPDGGRQPAEMPGGVVVPEIRYRLD